MKTTSVIIFGDLFSFPDGSATTNRVYTFARGFIENGIGVHVVCFENNYLDQKEGIIDGIRYYHPFRPRKRSRYFVARNWQKIKKFAYTVSLVWKIKRQEKIIAINGFSNFLTTHVFGYLLSRTTGAKYIIECEEHPLKDYQRNAIDRLLGNLILRLEVALSDGVCCISHFLIDFFRGLGVNPQKLFLVPSTVDPNRFRTLKKKPVEYHYVGYFGSLTFARDNIDMLISAYADFSRKNGDIRLVLGGYCSDVEKQNIVNLITILNIKERVLLLDFLTREEIAQYVIHADVLVMVRSKDMQSQASFPSKLPEFLASSNPVISVSVGEIPLYIKDGQDAFLVESGDVDALSEKLDFVYRHPQLAYTVGQNGKQLVDTVFNYKYQAQRMIGFIYSL